MESRSKLKWYKIFAVATYAAGILLHISRIVYGADFFLEHILTLDNDKIFSIPMLLASVLSVVAYKAIDFKALWQKIVYVVITLYTFVSVPVHIKSWFTQDLKQIEAFPQYYSWIILPVLLGMLLFTISLKPKQ